MNLFRRAALLLLMCALATAAWPQARPRIEKAADLPRFTYPVKGSLEGIMRHDDRFGTLAAALQRDMEAVLAHYDIADKATRRGLLNQLALLDFMAGRYGAALARAEEVRALEDKPADKLLSGLRLRAMAAAAGSAAPGTEAYRAAVKERIARELEAAPFEVVANEVRELKASAEVIGETLILGDVREVMQPIVRRTGRLSSDFTPGLVRARFALVATLPLKPVFIEVFTAYLDAHQVAKADIWAARDVVLAPGLDLAPVPVAVWDSGVDASLFPGQLALDAKGRPLFIAFDKHGRPSSSAMQPLPPGVQARLPQLQDQTKGFSDLQSNIDSPEASQIKQMLSLLPAADYRNRIEELGLMGNHEHGTHVAGIALAGNPYARLVIGRIEFDHHLKPDPCPSLEGARRDAAAVRATVAFFKAHGVRVANMSWGGDLASIETALEQCGIGRTPAERRTRARRYFEISRQALTEAFRGAPGILFVAAAGNSNNDPSFVEDVPAAIELPNVLTVGAVDLAGDEAGFTSYGRTVKVHANGYQVESFIPGGRRVALSGTSMAAPQVTGLAAKLLAVNPRLTPTDLVRIITGTAERTADGRRHLMHPKKALEAARGG